MKRFQKILTIGLILITQFILICPISGSSTNKVSFTEILVTTEFNGVIGVNAADIDPRIR